MPSTLRTLCTLVAVLVPPVTSFAQTPHLAEPAEHAAPPPASLAAPVARQPLFVGPSTQQLGGDGQIVHQDTGVYPQACCCEPPGLFQWIKGYFCVSRYSQLGRFFEGPFGDSLAAHFNTHIVNGVAGRLVLYRYDFADETSASATQLTAHGTSKLSKLVGLIAYYNFVVVIEPTPGKAGLDEARRNSVLRALAELGLELSPEMVVVREPEPLGLAGDEAEKIHEQMVPSGASSKNGGGAAGGAGGGVMLPGFMAPPIGQ